MAKRKTQIRPRLSFDFHLDEYEKDGETIFRERENKWERARVPGFKPTGSAIFIKTFIGEGNHLFTDRHYPAIRELIVENVYDLDNKSAAIAGGINLVAIKSKMTPTEASAYLIEQGVPECFGVAQVVIDNPITRRGGLRHTFIVVGIPSGHEGAMLMFMFENSAN